MKRPSQSTLTRWFFGPTAGPECPKSRRFRLGVQGLESRQMLSAMSIIGSPVAAELAKPAGLDFPAADVSVEEAAILASRTAWTPIAQRDNGSTGTADSMAANLADGFRGIPERVGLEHPVLDSTGGDETASRPLTIRPFAERGQLEHPVGDMTASGLADRLNHGELQARDEVFSSYDEGSLSALAGVTSLRTRAGLGQTL